MTAVPGFFHQPTTLFQRTTASDFCLEYYGFVPDVEKQNNCVMASPATTLILLFAMQNSNKSYRWKRVTWLELFSKMGMFLKGTPTLVSGEYENEYEFGKTRCVKWAIKVVE